MSHPHVDQSDRDAIEDRGIVENDRTPDMRRAPVAADALRNDHPAVTTTTGEI